jgi:hypothetical protein
MDFPNSPIFPYTSFAEYQPVSYRVDATPALCWCKTKSTSENSVVFSDAHACGAGCDMNIVPPLPGAVGSYSA